MSIQGSVLMTVMDITTQLGKDPYGRTWPSRDLTLSQVDSCGRFSWLELSLVQTFEVLKYESHTYVLK